MTTAGTRVILFIALAASSLAVLVSVITSINLYNDINSLQDEVTVSLDEFKVGFAYLSFT